MTEISATALIKTGAPISVFSLNSSTVQNTPPFLGNSNCLVNSTHLMPSSSNEPRLQVNRRKGSIPHKLYTTVNRQNLDETYDHAPTYNEYDDSVKLEKLYEDEINGLDESSSTFMLHPVQRENGNSSLSEVGKSPQISSSAKKSKQKSATEVISEKVEPTGLVPFRTRDQHYKKKEGTKYPALVSPLGYEYLRQGTAAVGLDVYVCSKRKTARCQARVNLNQDRSVGEFTHREHNHCSPYFPFNPNSKAKPKLRPGEFKTRQEPRKPVINGDAKPEWDEPPGIVHFKCRQSAQKDWRGNASRMLISKKGYEYRRRKVLGNGISEYACNRKNSEPYCSVRLEIRNDENFGVFVLTQHNHPPKYPDSESMNL